METIILITQIFGCSFILLFILAALLNVWCFINDKIYIKREDKRLEKFSLKFSPTKKPKDFTYRRNILNSLPIIEIDNYHLITYKDNKNSLRLEIYKQHPDNKNRFECMNIIVEEEYKDQFRYLATYNLDDDIKKPENIYYYSKFKSKYISILDLLNDVILKLELGLKNDEKIAKNRAKSKK